MANNYLEKKESLPGVFMFSWPSLQINNPRVDYKLKTVRKWMIPTNIIQML